MLIIAMPLFVAGFIWNIYYQQFKKYKLTSGQWFEIIFKDYTIWSLVVANILIAAITLSGGRDFVDLLWVYWYQTIIFGFFMCIKVIDHKLNFGLVSNFFSKLGSIMTILSSYFFIAIVGLFLCFVSVGKNSSNVDELTAIAKAMFLANIVVMIIIFSHQLFSFIYNRKKDRELANVANLWIFVYRVVPIMLGIFAVTSVGFKSNILAIIVFVAMKTSLDIIGHIDEHYNRSGDNRFVEAYQYVGR